ncbi:hypothetical protein Vadar_028526 [Vaccinium darrowii]|uniref:Uncharacterized protein n=1 Tax=Vaccinium darrowii TaxID=229202 RepID=A0ACB7Y9I0_9ERIC|nr:hypothetical protein Vadar_028526 [Vaccinium darrowii]
MSQWSMLPVELLEAIEELVILYADKVRLRCVSVAWHSPFPKLPHQKPYPSPCLLLPYDHDNAKSCALFDPLDQKFYQLDKLPKPARGGKLFKGSSHGWLVTVEDNSPSVELINPLTGAQLKLPPRSRFPDVVKYRSNKPGNEYAIRHTYDKSRFFTLDLKHVRNFYTSKIVLSESPSTSDDTLAVAIYGEFSWLAYCRKGYKKWLPIAGDDTRFTEDVIFCRGRIGKLSRTLAFEMYKFDDSIFSWVEVKDLGGESLFLGFNSSASISSSDFPECRGNCIYFSDDTTDFDYLDQIQEGGRGFDMGIYNLNDGTIERFPVPVYPCDGKNLFSPLPIWVVPKP